MIKEYIQKFRSHFLKYIFLGNLIYIGIIGSILFLLLIFLESIFYFLPSTKLIIIYSLIFCISVFILYWISPFSKNSIYFIFSLLAVQLYTVCALHSVVLSQNLCVISISIRAEPFCRYCVL